jgi:hypothetical protein
MAIWYICGHLVYFPPFWYVVPRKIWQPCSCARRYCIDSKTNSRNLDGTSKYVCK